MFRSKYLSLVSVLLLLVLGSPVWASRPRISFQHWFPDVQVELSGIVANNCAKEFQDYLDERIVQYGVHCVKTFNCIVSNCTEYTKANMASATVLLGLTPAILAALGSSTSELSRLSARRPVLAFLMVLGSPAANPIRTFDYHSPKKDLEIEPGELEIPGLSRAKDRLLAMIQLLFGLVCVINLGFLCATINFYSVSVMSCDYSDILVEMWIVAALVTHLFGVLTFLTRAQTSYSNVLSKRRWWKDWLQNEFRTCIKHTDHKLEWKDENTAFIVMSWITSVFTIIHLAYGTLQFSSMFFVGTPDTVQIVGRFMISAVICRAIVAYELAGQKIAAKQFTPNGPQGQPPQPENLQETGPHHLPIGETHDRSRSSLQRLASPDDNPAISESDRQSSFELRSIHERSMTSPEATEGTTIVPITLAEHGSSGPEEGERRLLSEVGRASTSLPAVRPPIAMRRARTEEV